MTMPAPLPPREAERLVALQRLDVLDSAAEPEFDELAAAARLAFGVDMALVSLVDEERQWFKARCGLDVEETGRDIAFCAHTILKPEPLIVLNAGVDKRFRENPLVAEPPYVRFYAGAPLVLPGGEAIGALCVMDPEPRYRFTPEEKRMLQFFASVAVERLVARARRLRTGSAA